MTIASAAAAATNGTAIPTAAAQPAAAQPAHGSPFEAARGKLGFGCMRLPQNADKTVNTAEFSELVDAFLDAGLNYFDTARPYHGGGSEPALKAALTGRHDRERFHLTNKLSSPNFQTAADIRPLLEDQLRTCGTDYFDLYLMHSQNKANYGKYQAAGAYDQAFAARDAGLVRHVGLSFHDTAEFLDQILCDHPDVECVQLQLNYLDFDSGVIQGRQCLEVCHRHNKPVIVMEPVKGGALVNLPPQALAELASVAGEKDPVPGPASYALRYAAGLPGVEMVLSGMGSRQMVDDNVATFSPFSPLTDAEAAAVARVADILRGQNTVGCTACRYCTDGCPRHINIPDLFACLNAKRAYNDGGAGFYYNSIHTGHGHGKASECVGCGACERVCPQHLPIRGLLRDVAAEFEAADA